MNPVLRRVVASALSLAIAGFAVYILAQDPSLVNWLFAAILLVVAAWNATTADREEELPTGGWRLGICATFATTAVIAAANGLWGLALVLLAPGFVLLFAG